ncbi:surface glycoprotein [Salinibaculum rarum]|uniref:surface glycoprotein n=1 Tax=Salinibaculum rarum TaxID=3058903 RepID=UPI00265FC302|nr:surface glycoprotein [Salinibaculum sp. KK48]
MTSKNEKLRGLFLAAIMVTSVFVGSIALTGTVAAANQPTVDSAVEYNARLCTFINCPQNGERGGRCLPSVHRDRGLVDRAPTKTCCRSSP